MIGATLVQLKDVPHWIIGVADYLGAAPITNQKLIPFIAIYYFGLAFLGVYLVTRLYLTTALTQTLGILTGSDDAARDGALRLKFEGALRTGTPDALHDALSFYDLWPFEGDDRRTRI